MTFYITAALIYFVINFALSRAGIWLERRVASDMSCLVEGLHHD